MPIVDMDLAHRLELTQAWRSIYYAQAVHTLKPELNVKVEPVGSGFLIFAGSGSPLNRAVALGFQGHVPASVLEALQILSPNFYAGNSTCFFAFIHGEPVGGGGMYLYEEAVELGGASTLPAFRGKGVHTALLAARLKEARRRGCRLAVVVSSPGSGSQRNIERVGFRLAYTKVTLKRL